MARHLSIMEDFQEELMWVCGGHRFCNFESAGLGEEAAKPLPAEQEPAQQWWPEC